MAMSSSLSGTKDVLTVTVFGVQEPLSISRVVATSNLVKPLKVNSTLRELIMPEQFPMKR